MNDIYERYCAESEISREEPILYAGDRSKKVMAEFKQASDRQVCRHLMPARWLITNQSQVTKAEYVALKKEIYDEIAVKLVPDDVLSRVSRTLTAR